MANTRDDIPQAVSSALYHSGFPFQTLARHLAQATGKWRVHASEYPWQGPGGDDHFLDLVVTNGHWYLTIECKKTRKESLTFLRPVGASGPTDNQEVRCLRLEQIEDATRRLEIVCETWTVSPPSPESEFCVVSTGDSGKDQRLLERDARTLVRATEAFARQCRDTFRRDADPPPGTDTLLVPVIVTNAPLFTARYRPTDVSPETGGFQKTPDEIRDAPWIRFRKAFTSEGGPELGDRTVLIVNASALVEFLNAFELPPLQRIDPVPVRLR
jgi:hypothetical protein